MDPFIKRNRLSVAKRKSTGERNIIYDFLVNTMRLKKSSTIATACIAEKPRTFFLGNSMVEIMVLVTVVAIAGGALSF